MAEIYPEITEIRTIYDDDEANELLHNGWILMDWRLDCDGSVYMLGLNEDFAEFIGDGLEPLSSKFEGTL